MDRIELINMEFFAHHGCFCEEQIIGNKFIVNFWVEADLSKPAKTDNIEDALNYQVVYSIIKKEVLKKSHLLEHVARRILEAVKAEFPQIEKAQVTPLATSIPYYEIKMDCTVSNEDTFSNNVAKLSKALADFYKHKRPGQIEKELRKARKEGNRYKKLGNKLIDYSELSIVKSFPILKLGKNTSAAELRKLTKTQTPLALNEHY